jgi:hypothetical protein
VLAFTADELNALFRREVDDIIADSTLGDEDRLWKEVDVYGYITEAVDKVARKTGGLTKVLTLAFSDGEPLVYLPRAMLDIREARVVGQDSMLTEINAHESARGMVTDAGFVSQGMFGDNVGTPRYYTRDYERKALRLTPIPNVDGTIELQCAATVSVPFISGMPLPLLDPPDTRLILHYMKFLAYRKHDVATLDTKKSDDFKALFDEEIVDRECEVRRIRRAPGVVRMDW